MALNWDRLAKDWENDALHREFVDSAYATLIKTTTTEGKHILDWGCGTGLMTEQVCFDAKSVVALDASEAMIEELEYKKLSNVEPVVDELTRGLVAQHPAFRKQFDLVIASSVCGYVSNISQSLSIVYSLLDPGGCFIHWDWISEGEYDDGVSMLEMQDELILAGFNDVRVRQAFLIQTPAGERAVMMGVAVK